MLNGMRVTHGGALGEAAAGAAARAGPADMETRSSAAASRRRHMRTGTSRPPEKLPSEEWKPAPAATAPLISAATSDALPEKAMTHPSGVAEVIRMDVKITQQKDNALMARKDIAFQVAHAGETTPSRAQVRQLVAAQVGTKTENVVIDSMESEYGLGQTTGTARAYKSADEARKTERVHLLKRNALYIEPKKKEAKADAKKEA